jgi:hypothetical protein
MTYRMSKITFRADDDLIRQIEEFDASKSEVMREALRQYLGESSDTNSRGTSTDHAGTDEETIDGLIAERVDAIITDKLERSFTPRQPQDVNVNITLDGDSAGTPDATADASHEPTTDASHAGGSRKTDVAGENTGESERKTCGQCGEDIGGNHVYCPNCGEKASHRVFCECGDELRSDWAFCPSCGRRTPAADVLDQP